MLLLAFCWCLLFSDAIFFLCSKRVKRKISVINNIVKISHNVYHLFNVWQSRSSHFFVIWFTHCCCCCCCSFRQFFHKFSSTSKIIRQYSKTNRCSRKKKMFWICREIKGNSVTVRMLFIHNANVCLFFFIVAFLVQCELNGLEWNDSKYSCVRFIQCSSACNEAKLFSLFFWFGVFFFLFALIFFHSLAVKRTSDR